jgi:ABC-type branched-subunit amino acid transport system ATPase component
MLDVEGLNVWYGSSQAIFDLSINCDESQCVALVGRNGAGKTTTLRGLMNTSVVRRRGQIRVAGRDTSRLRTSAIARLGVSWVPEDRRIFPRLTVAQNVALGGCAAHARDRRDLTEIVGLFPTLKPLLARSGSHLSGGEQQLVAIARSLVSRPRLLLLDEPSEGLAPVIVEQIQGMVQRLREELQLAVVLAEQNLRFVAAVAQHVYVIERGRIVYSAGTEEFVKNREVQETYLSMSAGGYRGE